MKRVAIVGLGTVSCLGDNWEKVSHSLKNLKSGIGIDEERVERGFFSPLTGQIKDLEYKKILNRKARKTMAEHSQQSYYAASQALEMAGLKPGDIQNPQTGLLFGCDSSVIAAIEQVDEVRSSGDTTTINSGLIFKSMTSNVTMNLNTLLGTMGASWSLSSACSSGGHAIGQAADLIALGRQQRMICGGAQEINWQALCSFDALEAFSKNIQNPEAASRPFDKNRDGLVPSGGSAVVILEEYELAEKRGAKILAEVLSYAFSSDGRHLSIPSEDGLKRAMTEAISRAGLKAKDIDYLAAHATSTPAGDGAEAKNIYEVFGDNMPPLSSYKGLTGHELWMSGASQVVYTTIAAQEGFKIANANFEEGDEHTAKLNILKATEEGAPEHVLLNAAGFGGTNSCLVLKYKK
jgi:3-oxoacyl-[acyl-carrier-protein] synthase-1